MKLSDGISFSFEPAKIRLVPKSHNIVHYFIISGIMILGSFANRNLFAENENSILISESTSWSNKFITV